jgi:hypothetical protein
MTARDDMNPDATCVFEGANLVDAAKQTREPGVGALPMCGDDAATQDAQQAPLRLEPYPAALPTSAARR